MKRTAARYIPIGFLLALACLAVVLVVKANRQAHLNAALVKAVNAQSDVRVDALLAEGADPNTRDETGHPPPPWYWGILHTLRIRKQPVPPPYLGSTMLMLACYDGDVNMVQALLAHRANVNKGGEDNGIEDMANNHPWLSVPIVETVAGSEFTMTGSSEASRRMRILALLLKDGASVNAVTYDPDHRAGSALEVAVGSDKTDESVFLLQHGADPNADSNGACKPPLHLAAFSANVPLVKLLLAHGANPNLRDDWGLTPLFYVTEYTLLPNGQRWTQDDVTIAKMLVAAGADVNATEPVDGDTILLDAVSTKFLPEVRFFLNAGANVNQKDKKGKTALSFAAGNPRLVRILRQAGEKE